MCTSELLVLRADRRKVLPDYLGLLLSSSAVINHCTAVSAGSRMPRTRLSDLQAIAIQVPPRETQARIVDLFAHLDTTVTSAEMCESLASHLRSSVRESLFQALWRDEVSAPLGVLMERHRRPIAVKPNALYRQIGIRSFGRGIFHKDPVSGVSLGAKRIFSIRPDDLILNIVFAWEGAVAVASNSEAGMCASHKFPTYRAAPDCDVRYIAEFFATAQGWEVLEHASPGSAGRNRTLNQTMLLGFDAPKPTGQHLRDVVGVLEALEATEARTRQTASNLTRVEASTLR